MKKYVLSNIAIISLNIYKFDSRSFCLLRNYILKFSAQQVVMFEYTDFFKELNFY